MLVALITAWFLWPASYDDVANLNSGGANIIAFGDSLTAGYGARTEEAYPAKLSGLIDEPIMNAGRNGDTTASALARLENDVLAQDPRIVLVGLGGNDFLGSVPIGTTEANLRSIVKQIRAEGAMVVLLGFEFPSLNADYAAMYERVAEEERCLLLDGVLSGILRNAKLKSDPIHPNAAGYALMAERMAKPVRGLIRAANAAR